MKHYPEAAMERAMKVQEVSLRAIWEADHVVAGGRDSRDELPEPATLEVALRAARL